MGGKSDARKLPNLFEDHRKSRIGNMRLPLNVSPPSAQESGPTRPRSAKISRVSGSSCFGSMLTAWARQALYAAPVPALSMKWRSLRVVPPEPSVNM